MKIEIIRFDDNLIRKPDRAYHNDSGADIFTTQDVTIKAHSVECIPTGIGLRLPDGYDAVVHCKSGLSKKGIWAANAPIDAGYTGEIHAILYNTTDEDFTLYSGNKVGQLVIRPVIYADFVEEYELDERGTGAFGSTGE